MQTFNYPLDKLDHALFQLLVANGVPENTSMEYKRELSIGNDNEKKEFLFDVTSFANHQGGDIIFGIEEVDNVPTNLAGIQGNYDQTLRQIEDLLRSLVEPRIAGIRFHRVNLESDERFILVMRIPKSLFAPHQVYFRGHMYFYSRANNGKFPLNLFQLRNMFIESTTVADKLKRFVQDRVYKVIERDTPAPIDKEPKMIIHAAPLSSFDGSNSPLSTQQLEQFRPSKSPYYNYQQRLNLDGIVHWDVTERRENSSFYQVFRSGVVEIVDSLTLSKAGGKFLYFGMGGIHHFVQDALGQVILFYN